MSGSAPQVPVPTDARPGHRFVLFSAIDGNNVVTEKVVNTTWIYKLELLLEEDRVRVHLFNNFEPPFETVESPSVLLDKLAQAGLFLDTRD